MAFFVSRNEYSDRLLADSANPRLAQTSEGQRETLRALATEQGAKLTVLAKDIVEYGLNPGDPFYVIQLEDRNQRFVVIEGNRRLAALRALENPNIFEGAVGLAPFFVPVVVLVSWVIEPLLWPLGQRPPGRGCPGRCGGVRRCSVGATPLFSPERPPKTRTNFR